VKVIKNKVAPPFKEAHFDIMYNEGISKVWELVDIWTETWVIKKAWAFYSYWETKLGQGRENAKNFLKENEKIAKEIEEVIKNSL
jgi:recombination protein RecA